MPWTNQGGRGGDGRGPWGGGGPSSGGQPPDLEELLKRSQDRLKKVLPAGFNFRSGRGGLVILLIVAVVWLLSGTYQVNTNEQGVVTRWGRLVGTTGEGLHYRLPWPIESVDIVDVTGVRQTNVGYTTSEDSQAPQEVAAESHMLTGDENIVDVNFNVQWVVKNAPAFLFNVEAPEEAIKAVAESAMREVAGQSRIENMMTGDRQIIQQRVQALMQSILDSFGAGVTITEVNLQKVDPPDQVIESYRDVQAARANMEQRRNEGQAHANRVIPQARGEAARILRQAEAYKQSVIVEAQGEAARFIAIHDQFKLAPDVTRRRIYLETMQGILSNMNKVIVDGRGAQGVLPYLPLPELRRGEGRTTTEQSAGTRQ
jgi:membrane protease subunit HflK